MDATLPELEALLLAAHAQNDLHALVCLYARAADHVSDPTQSAFYLTHAYVFALEVNHPSLDHIAQALRASGRL